MGRSDLENGVTQLRSVTEITPKSLFSFVNRSSNLYGFSAGAKVVRYSGNTTPTQSVDSDSVSMNKKFKM